MTASIVAVANQKGGAGKTTITMNLAGTFGRAGARVFVIDTDPQGSAQRWAGNCREDKGFPANVIGMHKAGENLGQMIRGFIDLADYIFVDCPPAIDSPLPAAAMALADLVVMPVRPTEMDLDAAMPIFELFARENGKREMAGMTSLAGLAVINARPNPVTNMAEGCIAALRELAPQSGIQVARTSLGQRTAYPEAFTAGGTVHSTRAGNRSDAMAEINHLVAEVVKGLGQYDVIRGAAA